MTEPPQAAAAYEVFMRVLMSLAGLLLVLLLVSKLAGTQLRAMAPVGGASAAADAAVPAPGAAASAAAAKVTRALEQAAAQRADDAASR